MNQAMDAHEGCNIFGWLDLQRVAGNFRVSVHVDDFFALTRVRQDGGAMCVWFLSAELKGVRVDDVRDDDVDDEFGNGR